MGRNHSRVVTSRRNQGTKIVNKVILYCEGRNTVDLMMAIHPETHNQRLLDAYNRAKTIHETKRNQGAEFAESVTTMYELMKELGVVRE